MFVTAAIFVAAAVLITTGAGAHEFKVGAIDIGHPWSRPTPKDANIAGGYLTITNKGKTVDRLIGGASPAAGQIEVHEVVDVDGMTKTRPPANGIEIEPGKTVELKPGSYRILLLGLKDHCSSARRSRARWCSRRPGPSRSSTMSRKIPEPQSVASPVPVRSTSTIEVRLRVLRLARARCPLSSSVAGCSASRAGQTMPAVAIGDGAGLERIILQPGS